MILGKVALGGSTLRLGSLEGAVFERLDQLDADDIVRRMWARDHTVWKPDPTEISDRLGWLDLPETMRKHVDDLRSFAESTSEFDRIVLLGMGGSSLAPEVFQDTFGSAGYPELMVLDSTHPDAVLTLERRIHLDKTLFIVSSKSGGTMETLSFFRYFWAQLLSKVKEPAKHFVAITDPGSSLEELARERGFRKTFLAPPEVGGRYSALSMFGLVPAAVIGVDIGRLLEGSKTIIDAMKNAKASSVPAIELGAIIGELAAAGRDKLTIITSPSLGAFRDVS
ncbi:MAG: phosphoheptose isomerase, partial [Chloroflexi bacterium]|nr:phosphoheptose isomerase [Chloroflexota bacterium]